MRKSNSFTLTSCVEVLVYKENGSVVLKEYLPKSSIEMYLRSNRDKLIDLDRILFTEVTGNFVGFKCRDLESILIRLPETLARLKN